MSKILITGNGFDLFHGLPTKYGHFMAIMETIEQYGFKNDITFEDLFERFFKERFSKDYESIKEKYKTENINFDKDKINELAKLLSTNSWYKHFKNVNDIETWIDFETEIGNVLTDISKIFNHFKDTYNSNNYYRKDKIKVYTDLGCFGIIKENRQLEVELKMELFNEFDKNVKEKLVLNDLVNSLENFTLIFNKFLIEIINSFYSHPKNHFSIPFNHINEIYTVNYTETIEMLYKIDNCKVVYLHGKLNTDDMIQNIVMGVSEITQEVKQNKMYNFTKYYQKVNNNSNPKFINIPDKKISGRDETIFYIIGHSLDESDKEYVFDLFKFLEFDLFKKSKICIFYYNNKDKENKIKNLFNILDKEIIVKLNNDGRIYFSELTEENIKNEFERKTYKHEIFI